jgi:hypothetical protein
MCIAPLAENFPQKERIDCLGDQFIVPGQNFLTGLGEKAKIPVKRAVLNRVAGLLVTRNRIRLDPYS